MNDLFIDFTGKDVGPAGTPQPGMVKRQYSAFPRTFTVDTFTHVWFFSSCTAYRNRGRSTISNYISTYISDCTSAAPPFIPSTFCSPISCRQCSYVVCIANATSYWPPLAYSITVVAVSGFTLQLLPFLISLTPCLFKVQSMKLEPVVFWQGPRLLPKLARPQRSHGPVRPAVCMKALNIQWNLWYLI